MAAATKGTFVALLGPDYDKVSEVVPMTQGQLDAAHEVLDWMDSALQALHDVRLAKYNALHPDAKAKAQEPQKQSDFMNKEYRAVVFSQEKRMRVAKRKRDEEEALEQSASKKLHA